MIEDKQRWNEKYAKMPVSMKPSALLTEHIDKIGGKYVLDIAAGMGRHAGYLANLGFKVDAMEFSDAAISHLSSIPGVKAIETDLDEIEDFPKSYNAILCFNYLNRRLFPIISNRLLPGGVLLFETFVEDEKNEGTPGKKEYLLKKNELLKVFNELYIFDYKERFVERQNGQRALMASLAAIKRAI